MVIKWSRHGRFLSCSGYPKCKNAKPLTSEDAQPTQVSGETCEKCGGQMIVKRGRFGEFLACSNYPKCRNTRPLPTGVKCPEDGGDIVQRRSKKGRSFYGCSNYPSCKFVSWDKPVPVACPECGNSYVVEKYAKEEGRRLTCPVCKAEVEPEGISAQ